MGHIGRSILAAAFVFAHTAIHAQDAQERQEPQGREIAQQDAVQEYSASMRKAFSEARGLKASDPQRAMAVFDEFFQAEPPAGDFDSGDPNVVDAGYALYSLLARMHWEAARHADDIGQWEKAAGYYTKASGLIAWLVEKVGAAYPKFAEPYENEKRKMLEDMEAHADEIAALRAKSQERYTNDDYTALDQVETWERGLKIADDAIGYYAGRIDAANRDAALYRPYAEVTAEKIRLVQDQIDKYKGGRGDRAKWVEGVVLDYQRQLPGYATTHDEKTAFAYRLTVLSPNSRTAPLLLEWLKAKGRAEAAGMEEADMGEALKEAGRREAELNRAIKASRPAPKK
jgi:hypothetical protein